MGKTVRFDLKSNEWATVELSGRFLIFLAVHLGDPNNLQIRSHLMAERILALDTLHPSAWPAQ
jgi:hypothetical protein